MSLNNGSFLLKQLNVITNWQGFLNAAKLSSAASGQPLTSHRILFLGAGSAGVGVAMQLLSYFTLQGLSVDEARERIWLVDSQGLIYNTRGSMAEHKKCPLQIYSSLTAKLTSFQTSPEGITMVPL